MAKGRKKKKAVSRRPKRQQAQNKNNGGSRMSAGTMIVRGVGEVANRFVPGTANIIGGLGRIFGMGAYTREAAESFLASKVPAMHATLDRGIRVAHHEYLGEVSSSIAFAIASYPINPGLPQSFPWLSSVAAAFQKWEDNGIVFYFKSTSATALNSTNTALGTIVGAVTYNPYQVQPTDKVIMLGLSGSAAGKPSEDNLYPVECKMAQNLFGTKLVRSGLVTDDLAKYDSGNFHLARVGSQAAAVVGELHVVYDITLKEPRLAPIGWTAMYTLNGPTSAHPFGVTQPTKVVDDLGITFDVSVDTLTISAAVLSSSSRYEICVQYQFDAAAWVCPVLSATVNATAVNYYSGGNVPTWAAPANGINTTLGTTMGAFKPTVSGSSMSVAIADGTLGANPVVNVCCVYVRQID